MTPGARPEARPALAPDLERVVTVLGEARARADDADCAAGGPLPSAAPLTAAVETIVAALFPNHFGPPDLDRLGVDGFVGGALGTAADILRDQVCHELGWTARASGASEATVEANAVDIVKRLLVSLPGIRALLQRDVVAAYRGDPAARSLDEVLLCYLGVKAITYHRLAHALHDLGAALIARIIADNGWSYRPLAYFAAGSRFAVSRADRPTQQSAAPEGGTYWVAYKGGKFDLALARRSDVQRRQLIKTSNSENALQIWWKAPAPIAD